MDDFYGGVKFNFLLKMFDRYPLQLPVKGQHAHKAWRIVFVTSNSEPREWYANHFDEHPDSLAALRRRLAHVVHVNAPFPDEWFVDAGTLIEHLTLPLALDQEGRLVLPDTSGPVQ